MRTAVQNADWVQNTVQMVWSNKMPTGWQLELRLHVLVINGRVYSQNKCFVLIHTATFCLHLCCMHGSVYKQLSTERTTSATVHAGMVIYMYTPVQRLIFIFNLLCRPWEERLREEPKVFVFVQLCECWIHCLPGSTTTTTVRGLSYKWWKYTKYCLSCLKCFLFFP